MISFDVVATSQPGYTDISEKLFAIQNIFLKIKYFPLTLKLNRESAKGNCDGVYLIWPD